ncbi:MAG: DUF4062 domain-containing protein [Deltaproteobacteria bacterium]|nr:DUF4062 domain-containing protein [Deltaproteobacteria bacterium]
MGKKYQIFISSTFEDLKNERQAVLKAILEMNHMPAGMELFPASDDSAWRLICDVIDTSDYYVLVIGGRYGSLDEEGISFTEKEYEYATKSKKPVLVLLHRNPDNLPRGKTETDEGAWSKLATFRNKVEKKHMCAYWESPEDLKAKVIVGLTLAIKNTPAQGWVRAGSLASEEANRQIVELLQKIEKQSEEIEHLRITPPEGAEKLAQGSDSLSLDFKVTFTKDKAKWNDPDRTFRITHTANVSWDELFSSVAPEFLDPTQDTKMKSGIARFLREKCETEFSDKYPDYSATGSSISETHFQTIRVQFLALGLIKCHTEQRLSDDKEKDVRVCELTPLGKNQLIKVKAIYRD